MEKLICIICKSELPIPTHCGMNMKYLQRGNFRKKEILRGEVCGKEIEMPKHCHAPMIYFDEDYFPLYELSEAEKEELKSVYGE